MYKKRKKPRGPENETRARLDGIRLRRRVHKHLRKISKILRGMSPDIKETKKVYIWGGELSCFDHERDLENVMVLCTIGRLDAEVGFTCEKWQAIEDRIASLVRKGVLT